MPLDQRRRDDLPRFLIVFPYSNFEVVAKADDGYEADITAALLSKQLRAVVTVYEDGNRRATYHNGLLTTGHGHKERP